MACVWEQVTDGTETVIIPDGCVDLIWLGERDLVVAGPDTGPRILPASAGLRSAGVRLRPGAAGSFLGLPASELVDQQPNAEEVFGPQAGQLADHLAHVSGSEVLGTLTEAARRRQPVLDPVVSRAADMLAQPGARIRQVARDLGISERHLHRRTVAAVGYAPKMLARVLRLRTLPQLTAPTLAERAGEAGYASQAHMSDEVRSLTGMTASTYLVRFLEDTPPQRS